MWGAISRTRRGVKPRLMSRRWRVCSGSSRAISDMSAATLGRTPWAADHTSERREISKTSAWRDTTHRSLVVSR